MQHPWRSALVTGASAGIGEAMTRRLANAGVPVVAVARRQDRLDALAGELGSHVEVLAADLTDADDRARVQARIADAARPIELLVNNAGFGTHGPFADIDVERSVGEVELNIVALMRLTKAALDPMVARRRGWVLNVSSLAGYQAAPSLATYAATKAFVTSFSEALHEELRGTSVVVTALCPGMTHTEFQSVSNTDSVGRQYPQFVWQTADEVAVTGLADCAKGKAVSVPGVHNKLLSALTNSTPRGITRRIAGIVTR